MKRYIVIIMLSGCLFSNNNSKSRPVSTYSIVAYDENTGELGVAVQSHWFSVGSLVPWAKAGVGAVATQSFVKVEYGPEGLVAMEQGKPANLVLDELIKKDEGRAVRQVAMIDVKGNVAAYTGEKCIYAAGHYIGKNYAVQANLMEKETVWSAMADAFENTSGHISERMMASLEAAEDEGGDIRGKQSASMLVVSGEPTGIPWEDIVMDIRVDDHTEPLKELRRLIRIHKAYQHANMGDKFMEDKKIDEAMLQYEKATSLYPKNPELPYWSAVTLASTGNIDAALPIFLDVFSKSPKLKDLTPRLVISGLLPDNQKLIERIMNVDVMKPADRFYIELVNERNHELEKDDRGNYHIKAGKTQRIFKLIGITDSQEMERIDWKTKNAFSWNDGIQTSDYPILESKTYTKNGVGETMIGIPPEMEGGTVSIYGFYFNQIDSLKIFVH